MQSLSTTSVPERAMLTLEKSLEDISLDAKQELLALFFYGKYKVSLKSFDAALEFVKRKPFGSLEYDFTHLLATN